MHKKEPFGNLKNRLSNDHNSPARIRLSRPVRALQKSQQDILKREKAKGEVTNITKQNKESKSSNQISFLGNITKTTIIHLQF